MLQSVLKDTKTKGQPMSTFKRYDEEFKQSLVNLKYYLQKTGLSIEKATLKTADEILSEVDEFWT